MPKFRMLINNILTGIVGASNDTLVEVILGFSDDLVLRVQTVVLLISPELSILLLPLLF